MGPYVSIIVILVYAVNVDSVLHHKYLNRILQDQNTDELQSIINEAKFDNAILNYLQEKKNKDQHDDMYNPVARFFNNNYNNRDTTKDYGNDPYVRLPINYVDDGTNSGINVPRNRVQSSINSNPVEFLNNQSNDISTTNSGIHPPPNENYQRMQTQINNQPNVPSVPRKINTDDLPYIVPPTNAHIPTVSTPHHAVDTIKPDTNKTPNYVIVNINGQPTLVQMISLGAIDLNNNAQARTRQASITTEGSNGPYMLQNTNNMPLTNIDDVVQSFQKEEMFANNNRDNENSGQIKRNPNPSFLNKLSLNKQPGFVFSMFNNTLSNIDPR